jgi:hypothetical protein
MDVEMVAFIILSRLLRRRERRRKKMFWIHPINMKRDVFGTFKHLFPDLCHIFHVYFSLELSVSRHPYYNNMLQMKLIKALVTSERDARRLARNSTGWVLASHDWTGQDWTGQDVCSVKEIMTFPCVAMWNQSDESTGVRRDWTWLAQAGPVRNQP